MKPKNHREITIAYLSFISHFTLLLIITTTCWFLFIQSKQRFINSIKTKKQELDFYYNTNMDLYNRLDSINYLISISNTKMINNEEALERRILKIKDEALNEISILEQDGDNSYLIYKKVLLDTDFFLESKKTLQQNKEEENFNKKKLQECFAANKELNKRGN